MGRQPQQHQIGDDDQVVAAQGTILRDQQRARYAYACVAQVTDANVRKNYKIATNSLGANLIRMKLAGAMAALERRGDEGARLLLDHLGGAGIPGLVGTNRDSLPDRARNLGLDDYVLATRELLRVAEWIKRAVQATF